MNQPTALFLADILEDGGKPADIAEKCAAELRRLHAENESLKKTLAASCDEERQQMWEAGPGGGCSRALSAEFQRDALLEALTLIASDACADMPAMMQNIARAAIKAAEENT